MKVKFRFKCNVAMKVAIFALIVIQAVVIAFILCQFFGWFNLEVANLAISIIEFVICVIIIVACIFLLTCHYFFGKDGVCIKFGFISTFKNDMPYSCIVNAVHKKESDDLYLSIVKPNKEPVVARINIDARYYADFVGQLKVKNPATIYIED